MMIRNKPAYSFDDVLMVPQHSTILSRSDVDIGTRIGGLPLKLPLLSANMDTVTEAQMALEMAERGGAGVLHRFASFEEQCEWLAEMRSVQARPRIVSVGLDDSFEAIRDIDHMIGEYDIDAVCIDVAHGDHKRMLDVITQIRGLTQLDIIAGNVATGKAACRLVDAGANIIKVGIGPGSVCSTRVVSGHGFPQLSAIIEVDEELRLNGRRQGERHGNNDVAIIADGGIRYPGDIVKALAAGADAVMLGSLLAGTDEAAGDRIVEDGIAFKTFRGMASREAQSQKRAGRTPRVEGVAARVPYRGPVRDTLSNLEAGIRSGLSYSGARTLSELRDAAQFVVVTGNTLRESHPHHPYRL